jgi:hypothetical protein
MPEIRRSSAVTGPVATKRRVPVRIALLALGAAVAVAFTLPAPATAAVPTGADKLKARSSCANERGLTRARHKMFALKYGAGRRHRRAFSRCVAIKARRFARRRAMGLTPPPPAPAPAPAPAPLPAPALPGLPMLPGGIPEMPGVRLECMVEQMEDPIGFAQEYPGGIEMCVLMESIP